MSSRSGHDQRRNALRRCHASRRRSWRQCVVLAACLTCCALSVARAEQSAAAAPHGDETATARHLYEAGLNAYAEGRFQQAIRYFRQADQEKPSASLSYNVARAYEALKDSALAYYWYRDYLARASKAPDAATIERKLKRLNAELAARHQQVVSITTQPTDAALVIDSAPVGSAPWIGALKLGQHRVLVQKSGWDDSVRMLEVNAERPLDVRVALRATPVALLTVMPNGETRAQPSSTSKTDATATEAATYASTAPAAGGSELDEGDVKANHATAHAADIGVVREVPAGERARPGRGSGLSSYQIAGIATLAAGAVGLAGGLAFEVMRQGAEQDAQRDTVQIQYARDLDTMDSHQLTARVLAGTGAVLALTGAALLVFGGRDARERPNDQRVSLGCAPTGCMLNLRTRYAL